MNKSPLGEAMIMPSLRYKDGPAAVEWLCAAFGFEKHLVVPGPEGEIAHAQLIYRNSMIMLGSASDSFKVPSTEIGAEPQSIHVIVEDVDAHCGRARDAGAEILLEPTDQDYGGRLYSCRDLEQHLWNFGSYNPWDHADH